MGALVIQNAKVKSFYWDSERCLSMFINLEFAGGGVAFGGYCLTGEACWMWLDALMDTFDLYRLDQSFVGTIVRIEHDGLAGSKVTAIGNAIKNKWLRPDTLFQKFQENK